MERTSNYRDPNESGISDDERTERLLRIQRDEVGFESNIRYAAKSKKGKVPFDAYKLHFMLTDEAGMRGDYDIDGWGSPKIDLPLIPPPPKGTGRKFTPKKKKRK